MVLGNMTALGLAAAVAVDLVATARLVLIAARIYERAILRTGAPVKLRRLLEHQPARNAWVSSPVCRQSGAGAGSTSQAA